MSDRTINFGESESEATYQIQDTDSTGGGNFVVANDTNANTVLLQYDPGTDTWEYAGDVDMNGGNVSGVGTLTADSVNTDDTHTKRLANGLIHHAASYPGSDAEERLDNALAEISDGATLVLENVDYDQQRTIEKSITITGPNNASAASGSGGRINSEWTIEGFCALKDIRLSSKIIFEGRGIVSGTGSTGSGIDLVFDFDGSVAGLIAGADGQITFNSGTEDGEIGVVSGDISVTDNGNNRVL